MERPLSKISCETSAILADCRKLPNPTAFQRYADKNVLIYRKSPAKTPDFALAAATNYSYSLRAIEARCSLVFQNCEVALALELQF
jgi:hypothetical protein